MRLTYFPVLNMEMKRVNKQSLGSQSILLVLLCSGAACSKQPPTIDLIGTWKNVYSNSKAGSGDRFLPNGVWVGWHTSRKNGITTERGTYILNQGSLTLIATDELIFGRARRHIRNTYHLTVRKLSPDRIEFTDNPQTRVRFPAQASVRVDFNSLPGDLRDALQ